MFTRRTVTLLLVNSRRQLSLWRPQQLSPVPSSSRRHCATAASVSSDKEEAASEATTEQQMERVLRDIVERQGREGRKLFLPWADQRAMQAVFFPFSQLISKGIKAEFLVDACTKSDALFRALTVDGENAFEMLTLFVDCLGLTYEDAMRFYAKLSPELAEEPATSVRNRMDVFLARGIKAGHNLHMLVHRHLPILYTGQAQKMDMFWEHIANFFMSGDLRKLMLTTPQMCLMSPTEVEEKYEYIYYHMGIGSEELTESECWMFLELGQIMARHEFLLNTGKYTFPDPKRPQFKKENPKIDQIFDTPDKEFATKVAYVSHEEWVVFQDLKEQEEATAEKDRPFEKVKPEMRKRYERRPKEEPEKEPGEL